MKRTVFLHILLIGWLFFSGITFCPQKLCAQDTFTDAWRKYRTYHYQTPGAWNRVRREVAHPGEVIWPLVEQEQRFMYLTGDWNRLIPSPVSGNTHLFKGLDDVGGMYELLMRSGAYGYIVYPIWIEEQIKFSEDKNFAKYIITKGFMNTLVTDLIYDVEDHLDYIVYNPDTLPQAATPPQVYGDSEYSKWALGEENYNLYNVKNYYCYFDNRPDSVRYKVKYTTRVTKDFDKEVSNLAACMDSADLSYVMIPYWMTDLYLALPQEVSSRIHRYGYSAYIINPLSGGMELNNNWWSFHFMDLSPYASKSYDLVAYCGDAHSINTFLDNSDAQLQFIYNLFEPSTGMINRNGFDHKPAGLNIYFPEFDFTRKKAMTQFVKSLSLVIDSLTADSTKKYGNLDLAVTFPRYASERYSNYLSGLQCFIDTVYFADFDANGLAPKVIYSDGSIDTSAFVSRFVNPFYLFRIPYKTIQPGVNDTNLMELATCDYATGKWGVFFIIVLLLVGSLILVIFLRYTSPVLYRYMETHPTGVVLLIITLVMEIGVFFFFMIEALSPQVIFFNLEGEGSMYLILIGLPVLPILVYFLNRYVYRKQPLP